MKKSDWFAPIAVGFCISVVVAFLFAKFYLPTAKPKVDRLRFNNVTYWPTSELRTTDQGVEFDVKEATVCITSGGAVVYRLRER